MALLPDSGSARGGDQSAVNILCPGRRSDVPDDFTGLEAFRADLDGFYRSVNFGLHTDEVGKPGSPRAILRMGNVIAIHGTFTASFAYSRHSWTPNEIVHVLYRKSPGM